MIMTVHYCITAWLQWLLCRAYRTDCCRAVCYECLRLRRAKRCGWMSYTTSLLSVVIVTASTDVTLRAPKSPHWPAARPAMFPSHGGRGPRPTGRPAKPPRPMTIGQAEGTPLGRLCRPVSGVKWSSGQKVSDSVVDQPIAPSTRLQGHRCANSSTTRRRYIPPVSNRLKLEHIRH